MKSDSQLHDAAGNQIPPLHYAAGRQISPLHFDDVAGSQIFPLHFAAGSQILPLYDAAGSQILLPPLSLIWWVPRHSPMGFVLASFSQVKHDPNTHLILKYRQLGPRPAVQSSVVPIKEYLILH
jgi:hypothetical protein